MKTEYGFYLKSANLKASQSSKQAMIEEISKWMKTKRKKKYAPLLGYKYLFAKFGGRGLFLIYDEQTGLGDLDRQSYAELYREAERAGLNKPFVVFAKFESLHAKSVCFHKVLSRFLE
ncbi:hypothetical protein [Tumebacillus flagellatus]|uniref:Uncharacterized protein n=1 Tax=Tumebacillus flagellatus TaxID=1157490 RepID=A0A074LRZ0_9BACL|nr:hypothetical protein [Tumebacillus flagellatus]KEO84916.1 hypothetical protein EL26_02590 [Tumebacillus flagellatus]